MKNNCPEYMSNMRRLMPVVGLLMFAFAGFWWGGAAAENQLSTDAELISQPDTLGKLAFAQTVFTFGGGSIYLRTANADGSGGTTLTQFPPFTPQHPSWSPDGAKIVFFSPNPNDIYAVNSDGTGAVNLTQTQESAQEKNPAWSANGKIAYERENQIWTMNANGTSQAAFSAITQTLPTEPAWSYDGTKMAFVSGGEIWTINADGTNQRRVTNNSTADKSPTWSGDGAKIVFNRGTGISVINADGTNETVLTTADDREPSWSSDNTKIAFIRKGASIAGIYTMDANGANQLRIIADDQSTRGTENNSPTWQPVSVPVNTFTISGRITRDGIGLNNVTVNLTGAATAATTTNALGFYRFDVVSGIDYTLTPILSGYTFTPPNRTFVNLSASQIADFTAAGNGDCPGAVCFSNGKIAYDFNFGAADSKIATINENGTGQSIIMSDANNYEASFSPDGTQIIFYKAGGSSVAGLYRMNADGSNALLLAAGLGYAYPSYSSDGATILFVRNQRIYKMNADGSNQIQLSGQTDDNHPAFSPDGSKIAFTRADRIYTMNADGTNQIQLVNTSSSMPSYSPDGRSIVYTIGGSVAVMNANGTNQTLIRSASIFAAKPSYSPDGRKIVFYNVDSSIDQPKIYTMNADGSGAASLGFGRSPDWQPLRQRRTPFDFDGDGRADVSVFRPSNGTWYLLNSQAGFSGTAFGIADDKIVPADYDGDGKTDLAVYRNGTWYLNRSQLGFSGTNFGTGSDIPVPADYDGDGKADLAVFRPSNGTWYLLNSLTGVASVTFGLGTDKPVPGDYNGDGKADIAVFRPSSGYWYTSTNPATNYGGVQFGVSEDKPAPADYDGDGKTDLAVFRPSNGTWYLLRSTGGFAGINFGIASDLPSAADYDGDGKADIAVFRNGNWYLNRSTAGFAAVGFGTTNDKPAPNAFVP